MIRLTPERSRCCRRPGSTIGGKYDDGGHPAAPPFSRWYGAGRCYSQAPRPESIAGNVGGVRSPSRPQSARIIPVPSGRAVNATRSLQRRDAASGGRRSRWPKSSTHVTRPVVERGPRKEPRSPPRQDSRPLPVAQTAAASGCGVPSDCARKQSACPWWLGQQRRR